MQVKMIKKKYLITLLGLIAIFIPFVSNLLNSNPKPLFYSTKEDTPSGTGLSVTDNSNITFWDMDGYGSVNKGDETKSFFLEVEFILENWGGMFDYWISDPTEEGLNLYSSNDDQNLLWQITYEDITSYANKNNKTNSQTNPTVSISSEIFINEDNNFYNYAVDDDESFYLTADYNKFNEPTTTKEDLIGDIKLNSVSDAKDTTVEEVGEVNVTSSTEANVSYKITPGKAVRGEPVTTTEVEWIDTSGSAETTLAIEKEDINNNGTLEATKATEGVGLESNKHYENTIIRATMSDGTTWETDVEPFDTCIPTFEDPKNISIDPTNDILEIQGVIKLNGLSKEEIEIQLNQNNKPVSTNIIEWEEYTKENERIIEYDISNDDYRWEPPTDFNDRRDNKNESINTYSLEIIYTSKLKSNDQKPPVIYNLNTIKNREVINRDAELPNLKNANSIKFEPGAIAGITIGVLFFVGIIIAITIVLIGNILFRRI